MGMSYVAIFTKFLCSHFTSVFTVDNILNKVEVNLSCFIQNLFHYSPLWLVINSLGLVGDKLM